MSLESLFEFEGSWGGSYKLWFSPSDPFIECGTTAVLSRSVNGTCAMFGYDWSYEGKPQQGLIVTAFNPNRELARAVLFDSFHMANDFMECEGTAKEGMINFVGSYSAPVGPDWRWRTVFDLSDPGTLTCLMYNIHPDGAEEKAVEAVYERKS